MQKFYYLVIISFLLACNVQQTANTTADNEIYTELILPVNPLLKRADNNPVIQFRIAIPAGADKKSYTSLEGEIFSGLASIENFELYYTKFERSFKKDSLLAKVSPTESKISFPINISLQPGVHYFWVHANLKENADITQKISFGIAALKGASNSSLSFSNSTPNVQYSGVAVRKAWDDSVHTYRIPGMITTDKGTLIGVYDIRYRHSGDLPANIDVGLSRSTDGGQTWEPMKIIMDMGPPHENNGIGDPAVLFDPATKKIWVAALWSKGNNSIRHSRPGLEPDSTGQFVLVSSDDDGLTWSEPYNITTQVKDPKWHLYFNGPGNGIVMEDGTLVFPSQFWDETPRPSTPHSTLIYSKDNGKTWKSGTSAKPNTTESQLVETTQGTIMLNMRDNRGKFRSVATTTDFGQTWIEHHTSSTALQDPVCMASFIKANVNTKNGKQDVLFFSNVNSQTARHLMTIKASTDLGESWPSQYELLLDERNSYGYSAMSRIDENTIGILYEGIRDLIFVSVPVKDILK